MTSHGDNNEGAGTMRYQGRITTWKDDRGFGFIVQNGGTEQVFVHIKSFRNRQQRPVGNEIVSYEVATDAKGRKQAVNVALAVNSPAPAARPKTGTLPLYLASVFLVFVAGATLTGKLPMVVLGLYLGGSLITYLVYAMDKSAARQGAWRTKEDTLHLLGLVGGWPGALLAQKRLRHKSRKASFQAVFWVTVVINCGALGWLLSPSGAALMRSVRA
jgi:uncharacterized membrane protein YsdA (DUF1294 family)/cold shock CspA family protein